MANAKKCDVCGGFYEPYNEANNSKNPNGFSTMSIDCYGKYWMYKKLDCCPECMSAITEFISSLNPKRKD